MTGQEGPSCLLTARDRPLAARNAATYQHSTPHTDTRANQSHLGPLSPLDPKAPIHVSRLGISGWFSKACFHHDV